MQTTDFSQRVTPKGASIPSPERFATDFREPGIEFRGKPFWSWNGDLEREELLRQLDFLSEMGMGGMFMHSRNGLKTEYLGEKWFELINACAEKAEQAGLEAWIYDEDRWPSGSAGGKVTRELDYRMRSIVLTVFEPGEEIVWPESGSILEAHLADLDGLHLRGYEAVEPGAMAICPAGRQLLIFVREIHPPHSFYNGGSYLDTLNREATDRFIEVTHEQYRVKCGRHFGKSIKGIFTDEPHRGFILCDTVNQPGAVKSSHSVPYTDKMFEEFSRRFGYSLAGRLPELYFQLHGKAVSRLKWDYVELLQQLFIENWARPCLEWCEANGLKLTGHVLHEDTLAAQVIPCGSLFRYYEEMDYPGIDLLGSQNQAYWVAKQVVSVARQFGKPFVLSELYGCTGWATNFLDHKRIGDWQAVLGVNVRCHHLSWYQMAGESKRDYPASIFYQSAWYREYDYVETYFARMHHVLGQGEPDCDVLVIHPGESLWAKFHLGWATWLQADSPAVNAIEEKFASFFGWLTDAQIDFDYGDEEQMGRMARVEVVDDVALLCFGLMRYRVVTVAGMETMRGSTLALLEAFIEAGGRVVFAGDPPAHLNAEPSDEAEMLSTRAIRLPWERSAVVEAVRAGSAQLLSVNGGRGTKGILSQVRRTQRGEVYIGLVNTRDHSVEGVDLRLAVAGNLKELDCRGGELLPCHGDVDEEGLSWRTSFPPLGERFFRITSTIPEEAPVLAAQKQEFGSGVVLAGPYEYELREPNALVLDRARYRFGEGEWQPENDILRIDETIREELDWPQRTGDMMQPWCNNGREEPDGGELELDFRFSVQECPATMELVMEQPGRWKVELNGEPLRVKDGEDHWFVDTSLKRLSIPAGMLREGENRICLRSNLKPSTDLEAIYLIGPFGVFREGGGMVIGTLPARVEATDLVDQGFPYYSGNFIYHCPLSPEAGDGSASLKVPRFAGACVRIHGKDGGSILAFPPYEATVDLASAARISIEVMLTRQNLFGPFHRVPKEHSVTGPDSFRTRGDAYSEPHLFFPSGLLESPVLEFPGSGVSE